MSSEEEKIAQLERELVGVQEMLAFVLKTVGEEVVVPKEALSRGLGQNVQIKVDDDAQRDAFVFSLTEDK